MTIGSTSSWPGAARRALAAMLCLLAAWPALAADDEDNEAEPPTRWALSLATIVDQKSAREFDGSGGYALTPTSLVQLGANLSDSTSNSSTGVGTSAVDLGLSHDFRRWSVDGKLRRWQATDIVNSVELSGGADWRSEPWSAGPRLEARRSRFDPQSVTVAVPGVVLAPVNPTASCTLNNFGYGLRGDYQGKEWGAKLAGMSYRYSDANCNFDGVHAHVARTLLAQLLGASADRLARAAARSVGSRDAPVDSRFGGGASWRQDELRLSLDFSIAKDLLLAVKSKTLAATAAADLGGGTGVDMTLGATKSGAYGTIGFVEFALRAKF